MNRSKWALAILLALVQPVSGQDQPTNIDELNRKYQDALAQSKALQDRINERTTENEKLQARVAELERQMHELRRNEAQFAERTFQLRSHYAAWERFMRRHPRLLEQWRVFLERDVLAPPCELPEFSEPPTSAPSTMTG